VQEWKRLAGVEADPRRRGDYGGLAKVFAELAGRADVWQTGLEGWNVEVSQVVLEWQAQALAKGIALGQAEMLPLVHTQLLQLLEANLKVELPADLIAAVNGQKEPAVLDRWSALARTASSLADVRAAFGLV
jgi:hypothetical protein